MKNKFTEIQKYWIQSLRDYPERQLAERLGIIDKEGNMELCCLGQGLVCLKEKKLIDRNIWFGDELISGYIADDEGDGIGDTDVLTVEDYELLNLTNIEGGFKEPFGINGEMYASLIDMNDSNWFTWNDIADYMEMFPENVFTNF